MALPVSSMEVNSSDETVSDAWDYKGRPAVHSTTGGWKSAAMILGPVCFFFLCLLFD